MNIYIHKRANTLKSGRETCTQHPYEVLNMSFILYYKMKSLYVCSLRPQYLSCTA